MRARTLLFAVLLFACNSHSGPTEPRAMAIAGGKWSDGNACLSVLGDNYVPRMATLTAGCAHGQFKVPDIRSDGTFDIDGTYGVVLGPANPNPLPPAHYSGTLTNTVLTVNVAPSDSSPVTYHFHMDPNATCTPPCV